jgi:hypothetical protein
MGMEITVDFQRAKPDANLATEENEGALPQP